jgi:arylformamidase
MRVIIPSCFLDVFHVKGRIPMSHASEIALPNALDFKEMHDISVPLEAAPAYPGDDSFSRKWASRLGEGADYNLSALTLGSHLASHLDFPSHLLVNGRTQEMYPLNRFIIPAQVIAFEGDEAIQPSAIPLHSIHKGEALLFKTRNSSQRLMHNAVFSEKYISLSPEAALLCVSLGVSLVGIDYLSVDRSEDASLPVHRTLLEDDILILEGIDLNDIPCGRYTLICLPLRITGAEASPVRAILGR